MPAPVKRWHRLLLAAGLSAAVIAVATLAFGPVGFAATFIIGTIGTAWYGDDELGTCLPVAILFLLILVLMVLLIAFMMFIHQR